MADTSPQALNLDVFGGAGAHYWLVMSESEVERINLRFEAESLLSFMTPGFYDHYWPGGGLGSNATFADRLIVSTPGKPTRRADFGKVAVRLGGERRISWTPRTLPDFNIDVGTFTAGNRVGGVQRLRFHSTLTGNIFREKLVLGLFAKLGYPAPKTSYAWVSSSVWGPDIRVPYLVLEAYERQFCEQRAELGGACRNLWEFVGDLGMGGFTYPGHCQFDSCDPGRAMDLEFAVQRSAPGEGYRASLANWIDWQAVHEYQCLSWILGTGEDALKGGSSRLAFAERADGKFQYLPASVDISLGHEFHPTPLLPGNSVLAVGCQSDPQCWTETISTCQGMIPDFAAADPIGMLNGIYLELEAQGMLRDGDEERYQGVMSYVTRRLGELPVELELNRPAPYFGCEEPYVRCGRECRLPEATCVVCEPEPEPLPDAGAPDAASPPPIVECAAPVDLPSSLLAP